jgi:transposase
LELIANEPDLTLAEIVERVLQILGVHTTDSSIDRFFKRHGLSFKKKDSARHRTGSAGRGRSTRELEGRSSAA